MYVFAVYIIQPYCYSYLQVKILKQDTFMLCFFRISNESFYLERIEMFLVCTSTAYF